MKDEEGKIIDVRIVNGYVVVSYKTKFGVNFKVIRIPKAGEQK